MQHKSRKASAVLGLAAAATVSLGSLASPALAEDAAGCTTRLVTAESATVGAYAPEPVVNPPIVGVNVGDPQRLANDTALNAQYFVDCVV